MSYDDYTNFGRMNFANPGSALRRPTAANPRIYPCPECGEKDCLTSVDVKLGYQCDECAERLEGVY